MTPGYSIRALLPKSPGSGQFQGPEFSHLSRLRGFWGGSSQANRVLSCSQWAEGLVIPTHCQKRQSYWSIFNIGRRCTPVRGGTKRKKKTNCRPILCGGRKRQWASPVSPKMIYRPIQSCQDPKNLTKCRGAGVWAMPGKVGSGRHSAALTSSLLQFPWPFLL